MSTILDLMENYLLLENQKRVDYLNDRYKDGFDTSHDTLAKNKTTKDIVNHFVKKADPSTNKEHSQWILDQYKKQNIRQEDAGTIKKNLKDFEKTKPHLEKKDLNQYKHISDLRDAVTPKLTLAKKKENEKKDIKVKANQELEKLYDKDGVEGYKIPNRESSISHYGIHGSKAKTNWCTAANSSNNMFNHYKGCKYTMHFPNGHVLQFHHQSNQIMDEKDTPVDVDDPRYQPYAKHMNEFINETHAKEGSPHSNLVNKYKSYTPEEVNEHMKNFDPAYPTSEQSKIVETHKISDDHFNKLHDAWLHGKGQNMSYYSNENNLMRNYLNKNGNLALNHAKKIIDGGKEKYDSLPELIAKNSKRSPELLHHHIDNIEKYKEAAPDKNHTAALLSAKHADDSLYNKLADKYNAEDESLWNDAVSSYNPKQLSPEVQNKIMDKSSTEDKKHALARHILQSQNDVSPKAVDAVVNRHDAHEGKNEETTRALSSHMSKQESVGSYLPHHYEKIIKHLPETMKTHASHAADMTSHILHAGNEGSHMHGENAKNQYINNVNKIQSTPGISTTKLLKSSKFSNEDLNHLWTNTAHDPSGNIRASMLVNQKLGDDKINEFLDHASKHSHDKDSYTRVNNLLANPKVKAEHLEKLYGITSSDDMKKQILENPKITHESMNKMFDKPKSKEDVDSLLKHPKVTETMQHKAAGMPHMQGSLSSSKYALPSVLDALSKSPQPFVRQNVAEHKNTPKETIQRLAFDTHKGVSDAAKKRVK
jgi:hypothetical protein